MKTFTSVDMNKEQKLLQEYAKEIGQPCSYLGVEELIVSHRILRKQAQKTNGQVLEERIKGRRWGIAQGLRQVRETHLSVDILREMTLGEVSKLIEES